MFGLLKSSVRGFLDDDCPTMAAALSYCTVFSLPPLLLLILLLVGALMDPQDVQGTLQSQLQSLMGPGAGQAVRGILSHAELPGSKGLIATAVGSLALVAWVRYQRTEATVSPHGIVERGFLGRMHSVARRDIAGVLRVDTYRGDTLETARQLFVIDHDGRCVFRMRGTFWDDASMDLVADILGVDEVVRPEPVTLAELRSTDPGLLYWFEGRGLHRR